MSGCVVVSAGPADVSAAAAVLAEAFSTDAHTVGLLPPGPIEPRLRRVFAGSLAKRLGDTGVISLAREHGDAATTEATNAASGGEILGVAVWDRPRRGRQPALGLPTPRTVLETARLFGSRTLDVLRTERSFAAYAPATPHWYLHEIATAPSARGRGVAAALLRERIAVADRDGVGCYLEASSSTNVEIYRRYGFVPLGEIPAYGTVPCVGMWRPAGG